MLTPDYILYQIYDSSELIDCEIITACPSYGTYLSKVPPCADRRDHDVLTQILQITLDPKYSVHSSMKQHLRLVNKNVCEVSQSV